jgi:hypothetical protein
MGIGGIIPLNTYADGNEFNADKNIPHLFLHGHAEQNSAELNPSGVRKKETQGPEECQTCKNRRYQDGSDDPGVSFKAPTKISPNQASSAVMSHEREHYNRENAKAEAEGREVVTNNIRIFTAVCPECGKVYVSGGETRTVTRAKEENASFAKDFFDKNLGPHRTGQRVDNFV